MKKNNNILNSIGIVLLLFVSLNINAQQKNDSIKNPFKNRIEAICRNYGDSIVIRWAPNSAILWLQLNEAGYRVEKVRTINDSTRIKEPVRPTPFKPLSKEEMIERYKDKKHPYGMVATQFLYGEIDLSSADEQGIVASIRNQNDAQNMRYGYSLQAADFDPDVANSLGLRYVYYPKNDTDRVYEFRVHSLLSSEYVFPGICRVGRNNVYKNDAQPKGIKAVSIANGARIFWDKGKFTAYFIERSNDGKNFTPIHDKPYITSHMDEEEIGNAKVVEIELPDGKKMKERYINEVNTYEFYTDKLPNNYETFYYRVKGIDAFGDYSKYSEIVSVKGTSSGYKSPNNVKIKRIAKGSFKISWEKPQDVATLKGYTVLSKPNLGEDEKALNSKLIPISKTEFIHKNVKEGELNIYTVVSVDKDGKFHRSLPKSSYEKDNTPPAVPTGVSASFDKTGMSLITWDNNKEEDLKGYKVYIRYHQDSEWQQITQLPVKEAYLFDVKDLKTLNRKVYYSVVAVDISGNHSDYSNSAEATLPDIIPPVAPLIESYKLYKDKLNIVYIASSSNDIKAHHLYRKEEKGDWKLVETFDLSKINNGKIYVTRKDIKKNVNYSYVLQAEDLSGLRSKSNPLPIILRGLEPEDISISLLAKPNKSNMKLSWNKQILKHHKKFHFVLYRQEPGQKWQMIKSFRQNQVSGIDNNVKSGVTYTYKIGVFVKGVQMGISKPITIKMR